MGRENQGDFVGSSRLVTVETGAFHGLISDAMCPCFLNDGSQHERGYPNPVRGALFNVFEASIFFGNQDLDWSQ